MSAKFDTLEYAAKREAAGVPSRQAAVHAQALGDVIGQLVTKADLKEALDDLRREIAQEFKLVYWMLGAVLAFNVAILARLLVA